jgi:hypothetical protein
MWEGAGEGVVVATDSASTPITTTASVGFLAVVSGDRTQELRLVN